MAHPYHQHREQQVAHRRVGPILKDSPPGAQQHAKGDAFSKVTSKSAAANHDDVAGKSAPKRFARGGKVKSGNTNIAIVVPGAKGGLPPGMGSPMTVPAGGPPPPPMAGPGGPPPPMAGMPGLPPGGPGGMPMRPPGMPMRARGGKVGGGASTGVGREQKAKRNK